MGQRASTSTEISSRGQQSRHPLRITSSTECGSRRPRSLDVPPPPPVARPSPDGGLPVSCGSRIASFTFCPVASDGGSACPRQWDENLNPERVWGQGALRGGGGGVAEPGFPEGMARQGLWGIWAKQGTAFLVSIDSMQSSALNA